MERMCTIKTVFCSMTCIDKYQHYTIAKCRPDLPWNATHISSVTEILYKIIQAYPKQQEKIEAQRKGKERLTWRCPRQTDERIGSSKNKLTPIVDQI